MAGCVLLKPKTAELMPSSAVTRNQSPPEFHEVRDTHGNETNPSRKQAVCGPKPLHKCPENRENSPYSRLVASWSTSGVLDGRWLSRSVAPLPRAVFLLVA